MFSEGNAFDPDRTDTISHRSEGLRAFLLLVLLVYTRGCLIPTVCEIYDDRGKERRERDIDIQRDKERER